MRRGPILILGIGAAACAVATFGRGDEAPAYTFKSATAPAAAERIGRELSQQFRRYRLLWPPRVTPTAPPTIELYGTLDEYRRALAGRGLAIAGAACFVPDAGVVLLGYDGARYDAALRAARENAERLRTQLRTATARLNAQLKAEDDRLRRAGTSQKDRERLLGDLRAAAKRETADVRRRLDAAESELEGLLKRATSELTSAAKHEAFHAYVAAYVYPRRDAGGGSLPRWLDEGMAQMVEYGAWSGERLVVERPSPELRRRLQQARRRAGAEADELFDLRALLEADGGRFVPPADVAGDSEAAADSRRLYLAAWSLAQFLAVAGKLTPGEALDRYVADDASPPTARFERWLGRPLRDVEKEWREYVRNL